MPDSDPMSFLSRLFGGSPQTTPAAAFVADRDPAAPVLDVRTPKEFADGHLAGAVNVDVNAPGFREHVERLGLPADAPVYLYCRSGTRSGRATDLLHQMGHAGAVNAGGFAALRDAGAETA